MNDTRPPAELEALGAFAATLRLEAIPRATVGIAQLAILNIIGGILVSDHSGLNPGRDALRRYAMRQGAAPRARILGTLDRTSPGLAALVTSGSAMMAHGDDWSWPARTHLSAVVLPAALAMAESEGRSGADLISAFVAGSEVAVRVGSAILPVTERKIPFTSPVHGLATAAAAANLMRLSPDKAALALSIATDMGTGLLAQAPRQHVVLRTPLGGSLGLYAAGLAAEGIEARLDVLPAFCSIYGAYDPAPVLSGLGERFVFGECGFLPKLFHFSTGIYPTIHGLQRHQARQPVHPRDIDAIECETSPVLRQVYGAAPDLSREMTHFSLRLAIALALTGSSFRYEDVATLPHPDPEVRRLSALVRLVPRPGLEDQVNLGREAEQTVTRLHTRHGGLITVEALDYPPVTSHAADRDRVRALFVQRVGACWGSARAERIVDAVDGLDRAPSLDALLDSLTPVTP